MARLDMPDDMAPLAQQAAGRKSQRGKSKSKKKRTTVRLNPDLWKLLQLVAENEQTTASGLLDLFLEAGLTLYGAQDPDLLGLLQERKVTSRSPAYEFVVKTTARDHLWEQISRALNLPGHRSLQNDP